MTTATQMTVPSVSVQYNKHHTVNLYVLPNMTAWFQVSARRVKHGPAVVIEKIIGGKRTVKTHKINDPAMWKRIGDLMQVGLWALSNKQVAPLLPPQFVERSVRFNGTTKSQRSHMAKRFAAKPSKR